MGKYNLSERFHNRIVNRPQGASLIKLQPCGRTLEQIQFGLPRRIIRSSVARKKSCHRTGPVLRLPLPQSVESRPWASEAISDHYSCLARPVEFRSPCDSSSRPNTTHRLTLGNLFYSHNKHFTLRVSNVHLFQNGFPST